MKNLRFLFRIMCCVAVLCFGNSGCGEDENQDKIKPIVMSVSPASVGVGGEITITGEGFGNSVDDIEVYFQSGSTSTPGTVIEISTSDTEIVAQVPANLTPGNYKVGVKVLDQSSEFTTTELQVFFRPVISEFSPASLDGNQVLTITGFNFGTVQSDVNVYFRRNGNTLARVAQSVSDTQIQVVVPTEPGEYTIEVGRVIDGIVVGSGMSTATVTILEIRPAITSFSPTSIDGNQILTITGSRFGNVVADVTVYFYRNGTTLARGAQSVSDNQIQVVVPSQPGDYSIEVGRNTDGVIIGSGRTTATVTILDIRPVITSFSPTSLDGNEVLTITGSRFGNVVADITVYFQSNGTTLVGIVQSVSDNQIQVRVRSTPGNFTIIVGRIIDGVATASESTTSTVTVLDIRPVITSFSPTSLNGNEILTVTGSRFGNVVADVSVYFSSNGNTLVGVVQSVSDNQIEVRVPSTPGNYSIEVGRIINGVNTGSGSAAGSVTIN